MRSISPSRLSIIVIGSLTVATVVALVAMVVYWEWLSDGESGSTTIRNIALVIAGVVALPLAVWRSIVADRQSKVAQHGLLNERYQKGAEMLGDAVLSVRLAGIYALQRLATEHPQQYHVQVMSLFCAFARHPTGDQSLVSTQDAIQPGMPAWVRQDVESVLEAIGGRAESLKALEREAEFRLDLRGAEFSRARILDADLSGAMLHHSNMSDVHIANSDLACANLNGANLSEAHFQDVQFEGTHIASANLSNATLQRAEMSGMNFHGTNLCGANLGSAGLSGAMFQRANVTGAWLDGADLSGTFFLRSDLARARLDGADLTGAEFLDTDLTGANFTDVKLSGALFSRCGLQPVTGLTQSQLDQASADPDNPPNLLNALDADTGEQLVWHGRRLP